MPTAAFAVRGILKAPTGKDAKGASFATARLLWSHRSRFFVGGGLSWNIPTMDRDRYRTDERATGDFVDWQVRLGYQPGVRVFTPPPPAVAPQNRPPTVQAQCEPCTVDVGKRSTLTTTAAGPDGEALTDRWTTPSGVLASPAERSTLWTAGQQEGPVEATVTVQVVKAPVKNYTLEDVHFDFDRYTLRAEATRILDEAVTALREDPNLRVEVKGHTCNIGTVEYNLALGDRRANARR